MLMRRSIVSSRPLMLQRLMADATRMELAKGASQLTSPMPVALEPPFNPIRSARSVVEGISPDSAPWNEEAPAALSTLRRLQVYLVPDQDTRWQISEAFPRQLQGVRHRAGFEIDGSREGIVIWLCCHSDDVGVVQVAFEGTLDHSRLRHAGPAPKVMAPGHWRGHCPPGCRCLDGEESAHYTTETCEIPRCGVPNRVANG